MSGRTITHAWFRTTEMFKDDSVIGIAKPEWDDLDKHIDAALRRAKAEGFREAIMGVTNLKADMENGVPPSERMGFSRACNEIIGYSKSRLAELDARAAQIEEGSK